ncbi:hypothetical protein V0U79_06755 [Hyphobacterium sp. HN65]|uniref:Uncharacterized protein n=1 Tax=Hyphobacterium lacteum TaxID=3116575 RepID=A0ABU7LQ77_9PROT|nr:hypothetical protein [Hyphobacterium sp. HN65]MEE2526060.1 hypothetical protein [Hyphobacterium sp. HN65]
MRNTLIALVIGLVVLIGGFFALAAIGGNAQPDREEVRVDVTDELTR